MSKELKPCPFCGGEAKVCDDIEYTVGGYWIECKNCHIQTPSIIKGKETVIKYWNTRNTIGIVESFDLIKRKIIHDRRIGRNSLEAFLEILDEVKTETEYPKDICSRT